MRYTGPVCRLCRREGEKLFLKGDKCTSQKCPLLKKNYAPGMHGTKSSFGKRSEFGRQLREKQKAKRIYQTTEKRFEKYYQLATKSAGITGDIILQLLELRLDNVVYRAGFACSRRQARQVVGHGLIKVNGRKCTISSRSVKIDDIISINPKTKGVKIFEGLDKQKDTSPKWLKTDLKKGETLVAFLPERDDTEKSINAQLIVEFYSK
ncbi:MAG: 30S ribosomal protein S4 [Nanoarchaeota archaeon]|nr:30S ribosomal protein S4 [Nanoarchaeota archaeon]